MKSRFRLSLVLLFSLALSLASCGGGGGGGILPAGPRALGEVQALFITNGTDWNDYVQGGDITNATDTACEAATDTACVHAGEVRMVELTGLTNCTGITAADDLGAFEWTCDDSSGTATVISSGLSSGYGLANLLVLNAPDWKDNQVTVYRNSAVYGLSNSSAWWDNPVVANTTGGPLSSEGTVYVIENSVDALAYSLAANSVSLVAAPGVVINGPGGGHVLYVDSLDFIWMEGMAINATGHNSGAYWSNVRFSVMQDITSRYGGTAGVYLNSSSKNRIAGVTVSDNNTGIYLTSSTNNTFSGITASDNSIGIYLTSSTNNTFSGVTAYGNTAYGLQLQSSSNNTLSSVTASNNNSYGVRLDFSTNNTLSGLTASNNDTSGIYLVSSDSNTLTGVTASNNIQSGVYLSSSSGSALSNITSEHSGADGFNIQDSTGNTLLNVIASNSSSNGISLNTSPGNVLNAATAANNTGSGIFLDSLSDNSTLLNITATGNTHGVYLDGASDCALSNIAAKYNSLYGIALWFASNNTLSGVNVSNNYDGVRLYFSTFNTFTGVNASSNAWIGFYLSDDSNNNTLEGLTASNNEFGIDIFSSSNNTISGVTASGNGYTGAALCSSDSNTFTGMTTSNNAHNGILLNCASSYNTFSGLTASNNGLSGVVLWPSSDINTLSDLTASDNGNYGVSLSNSSGNYFTGNLRVGNNWADCLVSNTIAITNPGLDDDNDPSDEGNDSVHDGLCIQEGPLSDFGTATTGITLASAFVGKVDTEDAANESDTSGTANMTYTLFFDWWSFDNTYRAWGRDGSAFPDTTNRGRLGCSNTAYINQTFCEAGLATWTGAARIWDWSALASDTAIVNSLSYPDTGDIANTLAHAWSGTPGTPDNAGCEAMVPGSLWNTDHCETTLLRGAVEIMDDGSGNDNTLCESGETCLYTPNMGSYQGHGALVNSTPAFVDGAVLTGITLKQFETNGY
jgi:parallel beta-helix repeat protein